MWKFVTECTYRMKVPGGWLYRHTAAGCEAIATAMVFVPDEPCEVSIAPRHEPETLIDRRSYAGVQ